MKLLFLTWQDPLSRRWYTVGRLTDESGVYAEQGSCYRFEYTHGARDAQQAGFCPLPSFPDLQARYESDTLFPLFANRLLSRTRPDYPEFVQWLSLPAGENDPFALLARSGGQRVTDTLAVFPCPVQEEDGRFHVHSFIHGLSHMPPASRGRVETLTLGERLLVQHDLQNPFDSHALTVRTEGTVGTDYYPLGFLPRYLSDDIYKLLTHSADARTALKITVERLNPAPAPVQFRLLCCLAAQWPVEFQPFEAKEYQPLRAVFL